MELMYDLLEAELQARGHKPVWFPAVIPESNFQKEAEHVKGFSAQVFWITEAGTPAEKLEERMALRPTSETAMYNMYATWIRSWRDLPLKLYQRCQSPLQLQLGIKFHIKYFLFGVDIILTLSFEKNASADYLQITYRLF